MLRRIIHIILLSVWTIFLVWILTSGKADLIRLLHPRLWWILYLAVVVLIFFIFSLILPQSKTNNRRSPLYELPGILILLIPLLFFTIAKEARLNETSLQNRLIQNDDGVYMNNLPDFKIFGDSSSTEMIFSQIIRNPKKFESQNVEIVCQSFVSDKLPEKTAMCYRYMITCCAADALPAFVFLNNQDYMEIKGNHWVKVRGPLSIVEKNKIKFASIEIDTMEYVEEPAFPWAM